MSIKAFIEGMEHINAKRTILIKLPKERQGWVAIGDCNEQWESMRYNKIQKTVLWFFEETKKGPYLSPTKKKTEFLWVSYYVTTILKLGFGCGVEETQNLVITFFFISYDNK